LGMFFGILLILAMAVGHYRGYRKLKRFACMCLGRKCTQGQASKLEIT
jgi:hypothetical protein